jgi:hypothetical protein
LALRERLYFCGRKNKQAGDFSLQLQVPAQPRQKSGAERVYKRENSAKRGLVRACVAGKRPQGLLRAF